MTNPVKTMERILKTQQNELSKTKQLIKIYKPFSLPEVQQSIYNRDVLTTARGPNVARHPVAIGPHKILKM